MSSEEKNLVSENETLKKIISEKDNKIRDGAKKGQVTQKENKQFQNQIINYQKTFGELITSDSKFKKDDIQHNNSSNNISRNYRNTIYK